MKADQFLPADTTLRSSKYLNNLIERDHRSIKSRVNAMLGFKRFRNAAITISGVELKHRIRKGQFNLARLRLKDTTAPAVWKGGFQLAELTSRRVASRSPALFAPQPCFLHDDNSRAISSFTISFAPP
jgi:hypothetical protein